MLRKYHSGTVNGAKEAVEMANILLICATSLPMPTRAKAVAVLACCDPQVDRKGLEEDIRAGKIKASHQA